MQIKRAEIERTLADLAALGPRHAAYLAKFVRPGLAERVAKICADYPGLDLETPSFEIGVFISSLQTRHTQAGSRVKWLRPYLAEAAGVKSFTALRTEMAAKTKEAYPLIWQALGAPRSAPPLTLLADYRSLPMAQGWVSPSPGGAPAGATVEETLTGGYDFYNDCLELNVDDLAEQYLLGRHPFLANCPTPLVLALDPCLRKYLFQSPATSYHLSPLHSLLHECLHAIEPRRAEKYQARKHGKIPLPNPAWQISEVFRTPLSEWLLIVDRRDHSPVSTVRVTSDSLNTLAEGVTDRLTELKLAAMTEVVGASVLSAQPVWPADLFNFCPYIGQFRYPAQAILTDLSVEELASLMTLDEHALDLMPALLKNLFSPVRAAALERWLSGHEVLLAQSIADGSLAPSPELAALLTHGWVAAARWLNLPSFVSPMVSIWQSN